MKKNNLRVEDNDYLHFSDDIVVKYNELGELIAIKDLGMDDSFLVSNSTAYNFLDGFEKDEARVYLLGELYKITLSNDELSEIGFSLEADLVDEFIDKRLKEIVVVNNYTNREAKFVKDLGIIELLDGSFLYFKDYNTKILVGLKSNKSFCEITLNKNKIVYNMYTKNYGRVICYLKLAIAYAFGENGGLDKTIRDKSLYKYFNIEWLGDGFIDKERIKRSIVDILTKI